MISRGGPIIILSYLETNGVLSKTLAEVTPSCRHPLLIITLLNDSKLINEVIDINILVL